MKKKNILTRTTTFTTRQNRQPRRAYIKNALKTYDKHKQYKVKWNLLFSRVREEKTLRLKKELEMVPCYGYIGAILTLGILMSIQCIYASPTTSNGINSNGKSFSHCFFSSQCEHIHSFYSHFMTRIFSCSFVYPFRMNRTEQALLVFFLNAEDVTKTTHFHKHQANTLINFNWCCWI